MQMTQRHSPRFSDSGLAARHGHIVQMREALKTLKPTDQYFAAPNAPVGAVSGPVQRKPDDRSLQPVLSHASRDMCVMMLHRDHPQATLCSPLLCPSRREISRMQIMRNTLRLDLKCAHQVLQRLLKELKPCQIFEVAKMLALVSKLPSRQRKNILEVSANSQ